MCSEKSCKAFTAPPVGEVSRAELPGKRTTRMLRTGVGASDASLRRSGAVDRAMHADPGDGTDKSALRVPQDSCAVEP